MSSEPFWEEIYQDLEASTFGKPSAEFHDLVQWLPSGAKVLDLGCGEGRNALFLAENGLDVTAIDISARGIDKLNHLAQAQGLAIRTQVQDMRNCVFEEQFDLIISHGCLHFVERTDWVSLLAQFKEHTKLGGYNVVAVFTDTIDPPDDLKEFCVGLFREGELFEHYGDWITRLEKSYVLEDQHPGGAEHRHPINKIVAQKP
jgi:tellurite methyltransferase